MLELVSVCESVEDIYMKKTFKRSTSKVNRWNVQQQSPVLGVDHIPHMECIRTPLGSQLS